MSKLKYSAGLWRTFIKPFFLGVIVVFMVLSFYPMGLQEGMTTTPVGPVPLEMSQLQAGGPMQAYLAIKAADTKQNQNNKMAPP